MSWRSLPQNSANSRWRLANTGQYNIPMGFADLIDILYEDNHVIAVNKPAGWPSAHFDGENETVDRLVKQYLKEKYAKEGNVFLGVVHRLDRAVTGVLLFAKTSKGAGRLSQQFRDNAIEKVYWAVASHVSDRPVPQLDDFAGTLEDWLYHDDFKRLVRVVDAEFPGAKFAKLHFHRKARREGKSLFELAPQSGRKHQLRVQLAARDFPIVGDRKYGSPLAFGDGIALHARKLTFLHPIKNEPITLTAELPKIWRSSFAHLLKEANLL